ncbi:hypothetical protein [Cytobacillus praedii]|nr:hypothetical protein [Cytobacillus praedii]
MKKGIIKIGLALVLLVSFTSTVSASKNTSSTITPNACSTPNIYCWEFY